MKGQNISLVNMLMQWKFWRKRQNICFYQWSTWHDIHKVWAQSKLGEIKIANNHQVVKFEITIGLFKNWFRILNFLYNANIRTWCNIWINFFQNYSSPRRPRWWALLVRNKPVVHWGLVLANPRFRKFDVYHITLRGSYLW